MRRSKPGPKPRRKSLDEFDKVFLTVNELGQCLGTSYKRTRTMLLENDIPTVKLGTGMAVHRAVAEKVINGAVWLEGGRNEWR